ncbi:probably inactive leucine-rich repeat receptor-like protein kinase At5g48380 [Magnolia sinica]|uniref:probably inactive leucine-rich repeat receptor-like protein kinase At5g48380 n=1 Tax=Magnolia sinica TaxID=86752 RepID=UPI002658409B|nr:probably inactive leucine-rich repeat receptor-like protein kinase At5g48380 [Magnolia sinica]
MLRREREVKIFMSMAMGSRSTVFLLPTLLCLWLSIDTCSDATESDIQCLRGLKASLIDPNGYLSSWDFNNKTEGSICRFNGIECWHNDENKVLNIRLSNMGLKGRFPEALKNCTSMTGLDLSTNELFGPLPDNIGSIIPYVTTFDLSYNNFTGVIPDSLGNCSYLNTLSLQHNGFTGQIPSQLGQLDRLSEFSVANNSLSGPIPPFLNQQSSLWGPTPRHLMKPSSFANNSGLCGSPLDACKESSLKMKTLRTKVIISLTVGWIPLAVIVVGVIFLCRFRRMAKKNKEEEDLSMERTKYIKSQRTPRRYCNVHFSMFEKTVPKMRLNNLLKATQKFSENNVIRSGRAGTMYKAMLVDGSSLAIKRLHDSEYSHKEFMSEMTMLGSLKHRNVVPLLGFCIARNERLLVYKYMPKGTLFQQLHEGLMEWPLRMRIAIGVARGLAWLHHSCDPCIIHRNISSKCILLDEDYEPKISKFRSAALIDPLDTNLSVHVNVKSDDLGLVAPEFTSMVVASRAGDVYRFGVVLLELITGQKPCNVANASKGFKGNLVEWITYLKNKSLLSYAFDRSLIGKGCDNELLRFLRVAVACVVLDPEERPMMHAVYQHLQSIGKRYHFADEDEIELPQVCIDMDRPNELNVRQQIQEVQPNGLNMQRIVVDKKVRRAASF